MSTPSEQSRRAIVGVFNAQIPVVQALAGAVFLDGNHELGNVTRVVQSLCIAEPSQLEKLYRQIQPLGLHLLDDSPNDDEAVVETAGAYPMPREEVVIEEAEGGISMPAVH